MGNILKHEEIVYQLVTNGELEIDSAGRIWRIAKRQGVGWRHGSVVRPCNRVRGEHDTHVYLMVRAMINGRRYHAQASRVVFLHYYGPIPDGLTVNHRNGNKKDNRPENLELATPAEQVRHARKILGHGALDQRGEKNPFAKLTTEAVLEIWAEREKIFAEMKTRHGHRVSRLAKKWGVFPQAIWDVLKGRTWIL